MIPSLILIVAGYIMFRCIEVFCKQRDGQYTKNGYTFLLICATGLFVLSAFVAINTILSPSPAIPSP